METSFEKWKSASARIIDCQSASRSKTISRCSIYCKTLSQNGRHGVIATLTVDQDFESVGGFVSVKLKIRKSNAKQMFTVFNALGQNGHHVVHRAVAVNKHVIKNVSEELKVKDLPLLIITNLLRKVQITFIELNPPKTFGGGIYHVTAFYKNICTDKKRACNTHSCTEWSEWTSSKCSVTCGLGTNMFSRTCNPICNRKRILGEFEIKSHYQEKLRIKKSSAVQCPSPIINSLKILQKFSFILIENRYKFRQRSKGRRHTGRPRPHVHPTSHFRHLIFFKILPVLVLSGFWLTLLVHLSQVNQWFPYHSPYLTVRGTLFISEIEMTKSVRVYDSLIWSEWFIVCGISFRLPHSSFSHY